MEDKDLIKEKINIIDLISEYLPLKKAGVNFKTPCPFHNEKTPSFVVSPERQIWHCFGCQKGGDIFTFLMEKEGMEFKEALEVLAKKAGVILQRKGESGNGKETKDRLFEINLKAQEFFHYILTKHTLGKKALEYLKDRGVNDVSIEEFGLGYAPNSWDSLTKFLLKRGFSISEIIISGLGVESKNGCYDRFRGRITFPMVDGKGKLRGFSGRVILSGEPKYINSPQTPIFDKGNLLFGMNLAKSDIRQKKEAILVEGEMDVIMSHQSGFKQVVASKGTALTEAQIDLLKKYTDTITLCFDMDLAGDSASRRGIEIAEKAKMNIKVMRLEGGKDAAEVIKIDPAILDIAIKNAEPIYDYYLQSVQSRYDLKKPSSLRLIGEELIPIWAKISDDLVRDRYIQRLANLIHSDENVLRASVEKAKNGIIKNYTQVLHEKTEPQLVSKSRRELLEEYLIILLLHIPHDTNYVPNFPETIFLKESWRQLFVFLLIYLDSISFKSHSFNINEFIESLPKELLSDVDKLYLAEIDSKLTQSQYWVKEVSGVLSELKKSLIKASLEKLSYEIKSAQEFGKIEELGNLNKKFRDLSVKLKNL